MNKEELLKMAREYGIDTGDNCTEFGENDLAEFANAILERAAVECEKRADVILEHEDKIVKESGFTPAWEWVRSARTTSQQCAISIRALKGE